MYLGLLWYLERMYIPMCYLRQMDPQNQQLLPPFSMGDHAGRKEFVSRYIWNWLDMILTVLTRPLNFKPNIIYM